jgi:hypothetical protein
MTPQTIEAIQNALQPIAEKIGQGAQFGWETVVRQQYIEGQTGLIIGTITLILSLVTIAATIIVSHVYEKQADSFDKGNGYFFAFATSAFILVLNAALVVPWIYDSILKLSNPAYYALAFFIHLTK